MAKPKNAKELWTEFQKIRMNLDQIDTPHLSQIKEIVKRIHFADIVTQQQAFDNQGDAFYKLYESDNEGKTARNKTLSYTIRAKPAEWRAGTGLVYGLFTQTVDKNGVSKTIFKEGKFTNYARFLADVTAGKVIYAKELKSFVHVIKGAYEAIDQTDFKLNYPVDSRQTIRDFLYVIEEIYEKQINVATHDYIIHPYSFSGIDWVYDCEKLEFTDRVPDPKELFFKHYDVKRSELDLQMARNFIQMVADDQKSRNNLSLLHAYVLQRKLDLIAPEYFFIMKDFGRTGKGLLMNTFDGLFQVNKVNFDALNSRTFDAMNEWVKFHGADIAHANETGAIDKNNMRNLRKIATCETVSGRMVKQDSIDIELRAVLVLDTNEPVDIGEITANKSRTVKISFKDRPRDETADERHEVFKPYWDFIQPNRHTSLAAGLSFLINSLEYLKTLEGKRFRFDDVTLRNYFSAEELTETQKIMVEVIQRQGYILSGDLTLLEAMKNDYGYMRPKEVKAEIRKVGIRNNCQKWIDGKNRKVHAIENKELFQQAIELINNERSQS